MPPESGAAAGSAAGRTTNTSAPIAIASAGAIHMSVMTCSSPSLQAALRRRGGFPFQQLAPRPEHPHERAADRVEQKHAPIGQERHVEDNLAEHGGKCRRPS